MANFVDIDFATDEQALLDTVVGRLQVNGWQPEETDPEVVFAESLTPVAAQLSDAIGQVPSAIFRKFGTDLVNVPFQPGAQATAFVTVTANGVVTGTDLTLPAGTQFELGTGFYFSAVDDIVIPVGSSSVSAVELRAILEGSDANGLGGAAQPVSQVAGVNSVAVDGVSGGGADAEDDAGYQDRLRDELGLLAPRPITERDFAVMARSVPDVQVGRSTAIDGYNPADSTTGNERMIAVFVTAEDGTALDSAAKAAIDAFLQARRELNFIVNVRDANYNAITVAYSIKPFQGFDGAALVATVDEAIAAFLSPLTWGVQGQVQSRTNAEWSNETVVRLNKLIGVIEAVNGVDYVASVTINGSAADHAMTGPAPLPTLASSTGTVV